MTDYQQLSDKYGEIVAFSLLMDVERHARLNSNALAAVDHSTRFERDIAIMHGENNTKIAA